MYLVLIPNLKVTPLSSPVIVLPLMSLPKVSTNSSSFITSYPVILFATTSPKGVQPKVTELLEVPAMLRAAILGRVSVTFYIVDASLTL